MFNSVNAIKCKSFLCFLFPILFFSKFVLVKYNMPSSFIHSINFKFLLNMKRKRKILPEIIFWFVFAFLRQFGFVLSFNKKAYVSGQAIYSKVHSMLAKVGYQPFKNFFRLKTFF